MKLADFNAACAQVAAETKGEWEARAVSVVAGRVAVAGLYYRGDKITEAKCLDQSKEWLVSLTVMVFRACLAYSIADMMVTA